MFEQDGPPNNPPLGSFRGGQAYLDHKHASTTRRPQWIAGDLHVRKEGRGLHCADIEMIAIPTLPVLSMTFDSGTGYCIEKLPGSGRLRMHYRHPRYYSQQEAPFTATRIPTLCEFLTRRYTERSTARLFQGRPSLTRSQTCQHHTPPPVDRR